MLVEEKVAVVAMRNNLLSSRIKLGMEWQSTKSLATNPCLPNICMVEVCPVSGVPR